MSEAAELLELNNRLLVSIMQADWETYQQLCDPALTAFEPESMGMLVEGMEFHHVYFNRRATPGTPNPIMCAPHVRMLGKDVALICYVRLTQQATAEKSFKTSGCSETRVWHKQNGQWKHVHFHRTPLPG